MFLSTDFLYEKNGLDKLLWTSLISEIHFILGTFGSSILGLATDSSCGVWGVDEWFASCMMV